MVCSREDSPVSPYSAEQNLEALRLLWGEVTDLLRLDGTRQFRKMIVERTEQVSKGPVCAACSTHRTVAPPSGSQEDANADALGMGFVGVLFAPPQDAIELYFEQYVWMGGDSNSPRGGEDRDGSELSYRRVTPQGHALIPTESLDSFLARLTRGCTNSPSPLPTTVVFSRHFPAPQRPGPEARSTWPVECWDVFDCAASSRLIGYRFVQLLGQLNLSTPCFLTLEDWVWLDGVLPTEVRAVRSVEQSQIRDRLAFLDKAFPEQGSYGDEGCSHVMELRCYFADWWDGLGPRPLTSQ